MNKFLSKNLISLAKSLSLPIYVVGGFVRNFLISGLISDDIDLASAVGLEELLPALKENGFTVVAEYKRTGTVVFSDGKQKYEFTAFRTDSYELGGKHVPEKISFTKDVTEDALRRDFKCNAVYYDIAKGQIVDPLNGINDIKNKVLDTVKSPGEVFSHDGIRLMRLCRFASELDFTPTKSVIEGATSNAKNIDDIPAERIYTELKYILNSDKKYPFSDKRGHYNGLKLMSKIKVLDRIFPELTLGRNMLQRKDFHNYDVLEHSLRCVLYAPDKLRLEALLHDVGKPFCMKNYGKFHLHGLEGINIAKEILERLKVDKKTAESVIFMVKNHMFDLDLKAKENKVKLFIVKNFDKIDDLLKIKQADYSACKDDLSIAPTVKKWTEIIEKMRFNNTPFNLKELAISAKDLIELGYSGVKIGKVLDFLLDKAIIDPSINEKEKLINIAQKQKSRF